MGSYLCAWGIPVVYLLPLPVRDACMGYERRRGESTAAHAAAIPARQERRERRRASRLLAACVVARERESWPGHADRAVVVHAGVSFGSL